VNAAMKRAYKAVKARDKGICAVCNRKAWDVAHILPRRFVSLKADIRNLVCLCRDCHVSHESLSGRKSLLELMQRRWGYEYPEEAFQRYLRMGDG